MEIHKELADILQLSPKERGILKILSKQEQMLISDISKKADIPRMTLYPLLNKLKERGLISYKRSGKRKFWHVELPEKIAQTFTHLASSMTSEKVEIRKDATGFIIHRNIKSIYSIFEEVSRLHKGERVKVIQPTFSMLTSLNNLKWQEEIKPINEAIVKNGIVVEGLLQDNYYISLFNTISKVDPERARSHIKSFIGRATDMVFVPKEYLNIDSEFLMFRDKAFIINWKDEVAIEIQNNEIFTFLSELFALARGYGKKIDQNQYLKELLEKA